MTTDLDAAVARLTYISKPDLNDEVTQHMEDLALLLADWERRRKDAEYAQNAVDTVIHYRNLAIKCGAAPDDMLGAYDRKLCVDHNPNDRDGYDFSGNRETWAEVEKVTAERDAARAEVKVLFAAHFECELAKSELQAEIWELRRERDRLQSIFEATMADLKDPQHDKTSVFWRMNTMLAQYAKDFP